MALDHHATDLSTLTGPTSSAAETSKRDSNPICREGTVQNDNDAALLPAEWTLVHFLTKRVAKDKTTFGDGFGTWYRQSLSPSAKLMHQFAFGGVNQGPQYYISSEAVCASERDLRRLFVRWHKHCRSSGCACDLNRLSGRDAHKIPQFQFYDARTHEPVRFQTREDAVCTRGCLRAELRAHWYSRRYFSRSCDESSREEYIRSRLVEMPLCYVPEPSREELEKRFPLDKKNKTPWWVPYGGLGTGSVTPRGFGSGVNTPRTRQKPSEPLKLGIADASFKQPAPQEFDNSQPIDATEGRHDEGPEFGAEETADTIT